MAATTLVRVISILATAAANSASRSSRSACTARRASDAFASATGQLEERLLAALLAGLDAGGEAGPVRSAGLAVVREVPWRETDLRVDWSEKPVQALGELLDVWLPQRDDYVTRGLDPAAAPSYAVPGDE